MSQENCNHTVGRVSSNLAFSICEIQEDSKGLYEEKYIEWYNYCPNCGKKLRELPDEKS